MSNFDTISANQIYIGFRFNLIVISDIKFTIFFFYLLFLSSFRKTLKNKSNNIPYKNIFDFFFFKSKSNFISHLLVFSSDMPHNYHIKFGKINVLLWFELDFGEKFRRGNNTIQFDPHLIHHFKICVISVRSQLINDDRTLASQRRDMIRSEKREKKNNRTKWEMKQRKKFEIELWLTYKFFRKSEK